MEEKTQHSTLRIDQDTFRSLYQNYWKKVFGVCYHLLQDSELAKELAQDIFESLWKRRETLSIKGPVEGYLVRAAKLEVFEYIRNQQIRQKHLHVYVENAPKANNSTQEDLLFDELSNRVEELLTHLPAKRQQIYQLNFQGASHREIATRLQVSEKTVEYHLHQAKTFLRRRLKEYQ